MRYFFAFLASLLATTPALAAVPEPGGINLQPAATRIMERLHWFHNYLLIIITVITIFVAVLLVWVCFAYSKKRNPEPRKFSHNTTIEIIWTVVPVIILVAIAGPSFSNLFYQENEPDLVAIAQSGNVDDPNVNVEAAEKGWITVKAIGMGNWAWTYEYPDIVDDAGFPLSFVSNGIHLGLPTDPPVTPERPRYLAADYPMVVPVNRYIRYQTASDRVIHSWTVPAFGVKTDAIPGRLNEGWFLVRETGVYYGQCSELCGKNHAFMPIEVRVVTQEQYDQWVEMMKTGDIDAATQMVHNFDPAGEQTQLASVDLN